MQNLMTFTTMPAKAVFGLFFVLSGLMLARGANIMSVVYFIGLAFVSAYQVDCLIKGNCTVFAYFIATATAYSVYLIARQQHLL